MTCRTTVENRIGVGTEWTLRSSNSGFVYESFSVCRLMRTETVQNLGVITSDFDTDDMPTALRWHGPY